jgi:hypothetical protein
MTNEEMLKIVEAITYKPGWHIGFHAVAGDPDTEPYVQLSISEESDASLDACKRDGTRTPWKSRRVYLSHHMCRQEVVGAVFGLIDGAERHEMKEWFRYKGASIYNPHLDPDALVEVARKASSFNVRENSMTMEEEPPEPPAYYRLTVEPSAKFLGLSSMKAAEALATRPEVLRVLDYSQDPMSQSVVLRYFGLKLDGALEYNPAY